MHAPIRGKVPRGHGSGIFDYECAPYIDSRYHRRCRGRRRGVLCKDFGPDGKRRPHKVSSRTKQDIIQAPKKKKKKKKSEGIDAGLSTSRPYKVEAAAHDWLEHGLPIVSARGSFTGCAGPLLAKISKRRCGTSPPRGRSRYEVAHRRARFTIGWEPRKQPPHWSAT